MRISQVVLALTITLGAALSPADLAATTTDLVAANGCDPELAVTLRPTSYRQHQTRDRPEPPENPDWFIVVPETRYCVGDRGRHEGLGRWTSQ